MVSKLLSRLSKSTPSNSAEIRYEVFDILRPTSWGFIDSLAADPCGLIRVTGWAGDTVPNHDAPKIMVEGIEVSLLQKYRTARPDLADRLAQPNAGLTFEYLVPDSLCNRLLTTMSIRAPGLAEIEVQGNFNFTVPHYGSLLNLGEVLHREHIYGSGPPNAVVSADVIALAELLEGSILDFGCGSGALISHLRAIGREASGIELDGPVIRGHLKQEVKQYITLYDGNFPSPYKSKSFDCVFCSEVLEHIPNFEQAVAEMARLAVKKALLTVPDMSAIPVGFRHGLVPWHLLEGTHVNFFTQTSFNSLLRRYFRSVEFGRISLTTVNDSPYYVSLVAFCEV